MPFSASFQISLDFDKAVQFNPNSSSEITLIATSGTNEDNTPFNSEDSRLSIQGRKLTLQLTNLLLPSTEYTFTLPQDFLFDDADNGNEKHTLTFTTADKISLDASLLSINTTTWYERKSTDNGSFDGVITVTYPEGVSNNDSLTSFFDTDLSNQNGIPTNPATISALPNGLSLRFSKQVNGFQIRLTGIATSHAKKVDNTSFNLTLLPDFFVFSDDYTSGDVSFDFDIIFGTLWVPRGGHQAFAYDDKLWVLGGLSGNNYYSDIWTSSDKGTNWSQVTVNNSHWSGRAYYQAFVYDDKLWVLGGYNGNSLNDIWASADKGINWSQVTVTGSRWSTRYTLQAFAYDDKLWVSAGFYEDDLWTTSDKGTNWTETTINSSDWSVIYGHQAFAYDDKLWVLGGVSDSDWDGIWTSDDQGVNWHQVSVVGDHWQGRNLHQAFAYDNKLWVLGGNSGPDHTFSKYDDIWTSQDKGTNWTQVDVQGSQWDPRDNFQAFAYDDKLWVLGGRKNSFVFKNDIWYSDDGGVTWKEIQAFY